MTVIPPALRALESRAFDRWVIAGERYEWPHRFRGRHEAVTLTRVLVALDRWAAGRPEPRDEIHIDVGLWLASDPLTALDPPLSVTAADVAARTSPDDCWIAGPPKLVVELSGRGQHPDWGRRVGGYLGAGVPTVWLVDPDPGRRRVDVYRRGSPRPVTHEPGGVIACPELPGFSAPVADFFR